MDMVEVRRVLSDKANLAGEIEEQVRQARDRASGLKSRVESLVEGSTGKTAELFESALKELDGVVKQLEAAGGGLESAQADIRLGLRS